MDKENFKEELKALYAEAGSHTNATKANAEAELHLIRRKQELSNIQAAAAMVRNIRDAINKASADSSKAADKHLLAAKITAWSTFVLALLTAFLVILTYVR